MSWSEPACSCGGSGWDGCRPVSRHENGEGDIVRAAQAYFQRLGLTIESDWLRQPSLAECVRRERLRGQPAELISGQRRPIAALPPAQPALTWWEQLVGDNEWKEELDV